MDEVPEKRLPFVCDDAIDMTVPFRKFLNSIMSRI